MLIPWLNGIPSLKSAPVTWFLFFVCVLMFLLTNDVVNRADSEMQDHFSNSYYMESQAYIYAQFISDHPQSYSPMLRFVAQRTLFGHTGQQDLLGNLALRDQNFLRNYREVQPKDPVAYAAFDEHLQAIRQIQSYDPLYDLGVFAGQTHPLRWISYIFTHSGFSHLLGNMFFLLLFGGFLEKKNGGLLVLMVFLGTGILGALTFLLITGPTLAPLIGASGAISGLMGYFCARYFHERVGFFYWLFLPGKKYVGTVMLPSYLVFIMWFCTDMAGYLSNLGELGGVAYAAHLGGEAVGVILGVTLSFLAVSGPHNSLAQT